LKRLWEKIYVIFIELCTKGDIFSHKGMKTYNFRINLGTSKRWVVNVDLFIDEVYTYGSTNEVLVGYDGAK
jgi:hypothetical protein